MDNAVLGLSEQQFSDFFMTWGIPGLICFMLFIVGEMAWKSGAGKRGTAILFFVLAFGMFGFVAKSVIQAMLDL